MLFFRFSNGDVARDRYVLRAVPTGAAQQSDQGYNLIAYPGEKGQPICMAHGSSPLLLSRLSRLEFPDSEAIRQLWRVALSFVTAVFSREGMLSREGRILIRGKFRRLLICSLPPLARHLGAHYGLQGGCKSCGASCNLLFRCPHWDTDSRLCTVYESRPRVCRMFPITPSDLRDRDLVLRHTVCGFHFAAERQNTRPLLVRPEVKEQSS